MITNNQLDTYFQKELSRPSTPFEYDQYKGSDPQKLANIGNEYKSLNKDQSIVDYLKYSGQDSSEQNRIKLGQQYGINNIGTPEGNTALLQALRRGKTASTTTPNVAGGVSMASKSIAPQNTQTPQTVAGNVDTATPKSPLDQAHGEYIDAQSKVADIDKTLAGLMESKKTEIARSGGIVDEAQLRSLVLQEQAPLIAMRKDLVAQQKIAQDNLKYYQQEEKTNISGIKKINTYDAYGNVNGQKFVNVANGQNVNTGVPKLSSTGTYTSISGQPITSKTPPSTVQYSSPDYVKSFVGNADKDIPQNTNIKVPGTMETVGSLYQDGLTWAFENGKLPSGVGRSTKAISIDTAEAIRQKGTAILNSLGISGIQASQAYKTFGQGLTKLVGTYGQLLSNEGTADLNFKKLISLGQKVDKDTYSNTIPMINDWVRSGQINVKGNSAVNDYVGQLELTLNEFAKVISAQTSGAAVSDSARQEVAGLLSKGQNIQTVQDFYNNVVVPDLANRKQGAQSAINALMSGATSGLSDTNQASQGTQNTQRNKIDPKQYSAISFTVPSGYSYDYGRDYQQAQQAIDGGADPATVWGHFNTLYK